MIIPYRVYDRKNPKDLETAEYYTIHVYMHDLDSLIDLCMYLIYVFKLWHSEKPFFH